MKKVLVSLDEQLLKKVDRAASSAGESRSAYVARILEKEAGGTTGPGADPAVHDAIERGRDLVRRHGHSSSESIDDFLRRTRDERANRKV